MPPKKRLTLMLPGGIGLVSRFGKASRSFVRVQNGSLQDGDILLQLTLNELKEIRRLSREMHGPRPELFQDAKSQYDDLKEELERLGDALQSTNVLNILKRLEIRRDTHVLVEAGYELYITTKSTSDKMQRAQLSCNSLVEEVEEGDIPPDTRVKGFVFDDEVASILTSDPFDDPIAPDHADNQIPSSVQNVYNVFIGCVNADNSDARVITMNNGGPDNSGPIHHPPS